MSKIIQAFKSPLLIFDLILRKMSHWGLIKNDEIFIRLHYFFVTHEILKLNNPQTFNEKLQWLKLYDRHEEYTQMVDKADVKDYVAGIIGKKHIIPTLGIWTHFEEINFTQLPEKFVLKCTHDSGGLIICTDKSRLNLSKAQNRINKSLRTNYFLEHREYPYANVKPRIIAEKYMTDESECELKDYKIFCFKGKPKFIEVDFGRFSNHQRNIYTTNWQLMDMEIKYPANPQQTIPKPKCLDKMLEIASALSKDIPHIRVDLYVINESIYFGELTFFHGAGMETFKPAEWNQKLGEWLQLPTHPNKQ